MGLKDFDPLFPIKGRYTAPSRLVLDGDWVLAAQFINLGHKLLAGQHTSQAFQDLAQGTRTWRLPNGVIITANINHANRELRIWAPGVNPRSDKTEGTEKLWLESGLLAWYYDLDEQVYPLRIVAAGDLLAHLQGPPPIIQGPLTYRQKNKDEITGEKFASTPPDIVNGYYASWLYRNRARHEDILRPWPEVVSFADSLVDKRLIATLYSGWARLWIQALAGTRKIMDNVIGEYGLTYDTGLLVSPLNEFWLVNVDSAGAVFTKLVFTEIGNAIKSFILSYVAERNGTTSLSSVPWHEDINSRLALCYLLAELKVSEKPVTITVAGCTDSAYAEGKTPICRHGWQWNRACTQGVLVTRVWKNEGEYNTTALTELAISWDLDTGEPSMSGVTTRQGDWRIFPGMHNLWLPEESIDGGKLALQLPVSPYSVATFEGFSGTHPVYAYFKADDSIEIIEYTQFTHAAYTSDTEMEGNPCYDEPDATYKVTLFTNKNEGYGGLNYSGLCLKSWSSQRVDEYKSVFYKNYSLTFSETFAETNLGKYLNSNFPDCWPESKNFYDQVFALGFYGIYTVEGIAYRRQSSLLYGGAGSDVTRTAIVVSYYDPTVYYELKKDSKQRLGQNVTHYDELPLADNFSYNTNGSISYVNNSGGSASVSGAHGGSALWNHAGYETMESAPDENTVSYANLFRGTVDYPLAADFDEFFYFNLLNPNTFFKPAISARSFVSAGGIDSYNKDYYTNDFSVLVCSQGYPVGDLVEPGLASFEGRGLWIGGA